MVEHDMSVSGRGFCVAFGSKSRDHSPGNGMHQPLFERRNRWLPNQATSLLEEHSMRRRPAAMERPYAVLHKNLAELESRLRQLSVASSSFKNHTICNDLAGKVDFLKALLAAEMESHANHTPPRHLLHIDERLKALDQALHERDDLSGLPEDGLCDVSMCSCTDECFEEEAEREEEEKKAEEEEENKVPEPEDFAPLTNENIEGSVAAVRNKRSSARGEDGEMAQHRRLAGCCCRFIIFATAAAAAIGAAVCFYGVEEESFLVPT